ncbi:hydrocephalus-inducing protein homolog isoform X2 [Leptinotarsa decemlineata]|uniref:hydrocephalus-inducing protein homolog isoform X2 n=1 Tax=Leptinotarsa decemlineata TaxID=7539 RepID=UPI003D30635A
MTAKWTCPTHKCKIMELLPFFLDICENEEMKISPSRLIYELQLPTEERLEQLNKPTRRRRTTTKINTFSRTPDIVIFQNFEPEKIYKTTITLLNMKPVSRHLSIEINRSPYFEIIHLSDSSPLKVAPGMTYTVQVIFKPVEVRDYSYTVTFVTDEEIFSVPIYAIGYRPLLNIPDHLTLKATAVRVPSRNSMALYNFGKVQANYIVSYKQPIRVIPLRGAIMPNQTSELKVICTPVEPSTPVESEFVFTYDDITLRIPVECEIVEADIHLDSNTVFFGEVYMGLETHKTVTVYNKSEFSLDFRWKSYKSEAVDMLEKSKLLQAMEDMTEMEKKKYARLEYMNIIDAEGHSNILDKHLEDESELTEDPFIFKSSVFNILPVEGRIVPNQSLDFTIIFRPQNNEYYTSIAYLDITGRIERLPVSLAGGGKGPEVIFNVTTLNISDIFLQATHEYQIVVRNNGHIPATVVFKEKKTDFGGTIKCLPRKHYLKSFENCKSFVISFTSSVQGHFVEKIQFVIEESKEIIGVLLVGNVVCPLLEPTVEFIDFGQVSYGLSPVKEFTLVNSSQVPVDFKLKTAGKSKFTEFEFEPKEGIVDPFSSVVAKVSFDTNALETVEEDLIVVMWGARQHSTIIPLTYDCVCPVITCSPPKVMINFCFLNYEYKRTITLKNMTNIYGYITYTPSEEPKDMTCILSKKESIVCPEEEIEFELTIQTDVLGLHEYPLIFTLSGNDPQAICTIICNGQGPVVSYDPDEIQFGKIELLHQVSTKVTLINDSPIWADMNISKGDNSPFTPLTEKLRIGPEDRAEVEVTCYLTDTGRVKNYINVDITNGESMSIAVLAEGVGSSIMCEPNLQPEYDAGTLLTYQFFRLPVSFTNLGKKPYKILWTRKQSVRSLKNVEEDDIVSIFRIEPNYFELGYNETQSVELIGQSRKPRVVQENFYCQATVDKSTKVETVMSCLIKAEFVDPSFEFSKNSMTFISTNESTCSRSNSSDMSLIPLVDYEDPNFKKTITTEEIVIMNETSAPLNVAIKTTGDFYIMEENNPTNSLNCMLSANDMYHAVIGFRPQLDVKKYSMKKGRFMVDVQDHPKVNAIDLTGEICFPTVKLYPDNFDFECIPPNSYAYTNVILQNITFLPASFTWEIFEDMVEIENLPEMKTVMHRELEETSSSSVIDDIVYEEAGHFKSKSILSTSLERRSEVIRRQEMMSISIKRPSLPKTDKRPSDIVAEKSRKTLTDETQNVSFIGRTQDFYVEWSTDRYNEEAKSILRNLVAGFRTPDENEDDTFFSGVKTKKRSALSNMITIEPSNGCLDPYEYIVVSIGFFPPPNVKIKFTAVCAISGGETESIVVSGMSSSMSYKLSSDVIDFGRQLFCEVCERYFTLTNDGYADFHFKMINGDGSFDECTKMTGWLDVTPAKGFLKSGERVKFVVKYFPGVTGEFKKNIIFEIGYLEPVTVHLQGYAIFSQLVLSLPRPSIQEFSSEFEYTAIASITKKYLLELNQIKSQNIPNYVAEHCQPKDMNEALYKGLIEDDWVVVSENDLFPSVIEIDLAMERTLLNQYIANNKGILERHTVERKTDLIPDFTVPPYNLDFGYVNVDKPVCYTVLILNYGSMRSSVKLVDTRDPGLESNGFKIEFKSQKLDVGAMTELFLIFRPVREIFGLEDKYVEKSFTLKLSHGGLIPVAIKATVTSPKIKLKYSCIDFGSVKLGTVLRRSILIENDGYLLSTWNVDVQPLNTMMKNAYWVLPKNGELKPGKKDLLNIYFTPTKKGFYNSQIVIVVEGNCVPTKLDLCGHGTEPTLVFSEKELHFKNSLPYSQNDCSFLVQNVSTFPIEYCFPDLDPDYDYEKYFAELFLDTHNLKTILLPERQLGSKLPDIFQSNYIMLLNELRMTKTKSIIDEEIERENSAIDPLAQYTKDEIIFELKGYYKAANRAGRALSLKVFSIDGLIYDELVKNETEPAMEINNIIEQKLKFNKVQFEALPEEDEYEYLAKKIFLMATVRLKKSKSKKISEKSQKNEKNSEKKTTNKAEGKDPGNISLELIWALLKKKFESAEEGIIIESLHSEFIPKIDVALDCLLRAIGCAKYIQIVILSYTLEDYMIDEARRLSVEDRTKKTETNRSNRQSPKESDKGSTKSNTDKTKQILKNLPKNVKERFEEFREFLDDIVSKCQFWDRRSLFPMKPPNSKADGSTKVDTKSSTRDSAKDSKASTRNKGKSTSSSNLKSSDGDSFGVPLWIFVRCSDDRYIDTEMLSCLLKNNSELDSAIQELNRGIEVESTESCSTFSIYKKSKRKKHIQKDQFKICHASVEIVKSDSQVYSTSGTNSKKKLTKRKYSISADRKSDRASLSSSTKDSPPTPLLPRNILQPGEIMKYQVTFSPTSCGRYSNVYALTIFGMDSTQSIHCKALCELPTLNFTPEIVFPNCCNSYKEKILGDRFTYFKEEDVFDIGSIIVGTNKSLPYSTDLTLQNASDLQCITTLELNENSPFSIQPNNIIIKPNESVIVNLSLKAPRKGNIGGELYISVKNNPKVETIRLLAYSCALEFHVSPKLINFEKVPTDYCIKKKITLRNSTPVDLYWKLVKSDWMHDIYKLSKTNGQIKLYSVEEITVEYSPTKEETNPKKSMELQIFDLHHSEIIPLQVDSIALQSEALEYIIEYQNHIDLGNMKGKTNYKIPFHLVNKGKCNVNIVFSKLDNILQNDLHLIRQFFKLNTEHEILQAQKSTTVIFNFSPTVEMSFTDIPVFNCNFVEIDRPEYVIKSFIITFTGAVYLSMFTLCPTSDLYFGYQQIFSTISQNIEMKNTGKFPFQYDIVLPTDVQTSQLKIKSQSKKLKSESSTSKKTSSSKKTDTGSGKSKDKSKEKKHTSVSKLEAPGFCIVPSSGTVEPNETIQITVESNPQKQKQYEETVVIFVSEPQKEDVNGRRITLHVEGSEPSLNFGDVQKLFKEHFIVEDLEQFKCPENIAGHCIFVKSENALYFRNVCINEKYKTRVYLQNLGQVIANVSAKVMETKSSFSVSPDSFSIEPYTTESVAISFQPDSINIFENKLEVSYNASTDNIFSLTLFGQSCVPQIQLLKPKVDENNRFTLNFDPTYIDLNASREIEIQNVGPIPCKVIMDLCGNDRETFSLRPCSDSADLLNLHGMKDFEETTSSTMVNLLPCQKANFHLIFWSKLELVTNVKLKIHTVNNPFEVINIDVRGQGYYNDIHLGALPTFCHHSSVAYLLDFGYTTLNRLEKKCFTIKNNSSKNIYKFEFTNLGNLMLVPRVGHLKPYSCKEIIANISTRKPICLDKIKLECKYIPIEYVNTELEEISWDDRQQFDMWDNTDETQYFQEAITIAKREVLRASIPDTSRKDKTKCIMNRLEPDIQFMSNAWETIPIFFTIIADYANYECTARELIFPETYVNQKSEVTFLVTNPGPVPFRIDWILSCDEIVFPKRVSSANFNETKDTLLAPVPSLETSVSSTTLFSSESFMGDNLLPFEIFPKQTTIPITRAQTFRLVFTPLVASQYYLRLISNISALDPNVRNMDISVTAESLVPECYFEIDKPEYIGRRPSTGIYGNQGEEKVEIVELLSVGIGVTSVKKFYVVNTSVGPLSFKLESLNADNRFTYFQCLTPSGCIQPGKKFDLIFNFTPQELGIFEERFVFSVDLNDFNAHIFVVGKCREPNIYFTKAHIDISATLWKRQSEETVILKNEEEMEFGFKFLKSSFYSEDHEQHLTVLPVSEIVPPKSEVAIRVVYNADKIGEHYFNLKCAIEKMKSPLNINVTAKCLEVIASVTYINKEGYEVVLDAKNENRIDLGKIGIRTKRELKFQISNAGQTGFFYIWNFNGKSIEYALEISSAKLKDFVRSGDCSRSDLAFVAQRKCSVKDFKMKLEISYGPTYIIKLNAYAAETMCKFSFISHNFGNCLVQKESSKYHKAILELKNCENKTIVVENYYENSEDLTVDFKSGKMTPNSRLTIPIYFHPRKVGKFEFSVPILVDSSRRTVKITGEAVKLNIQLVNPNDKFINFDSVKLGQTKKYRLQIINKTPTEVNVNLSVLEEHPIRRQHEKIEPEIRVPELPPNPKELSVKHKKEASSVMVSDKRSTTPITKSEDTIKKEERRKVKESSVHREITVENLIVNKAKKYLLINPNNCVQLGFHQKYEFIVEFKPTERIEMSEKIYYNVQDHSEPLCIVKGSCIAPEFSLDKQILTFSNVVIGCKRVLNVLLKNTGDTRGRFKWSFEESSGDFKLYPTEGFITPKSEMKIWISFEPKAALCQIFKKVKCVVNGSIHLHLQLVGSAADLPQPVSTVEFTCPVRTTTSGQIIIINSTNNLWSLTPVVPNKSFVVPTEIIVQPESCSIVVIQYKPKQMFGIQPDEATLFLPLPDGQAIIYNLVGKALPPLPITKMEIEVKCKQNHTENLAVENWLDVKQCFEVKTELMSAPTTKTLYKTFGHSLIEMPPNASRNYKWNIYVINEEQLEFQVVFTNIETREYMFYEISVKVLPSGPLETISLNSRVREEARTTIKLKNPINIPVTFSIAAGLSELQYEKIVRVEPYTTHDLVVTYCPLTSGEVYTNIEAKCEELGVFTYVLYLTGTPPPLEKVIRFRAELGDRGYNNVFLKNTFSSPFELSSMFDHAVFSTEKSPSFSVGETEKLTIKFEPNELGIVESKAVFNSSITGEYIYPLIGECVLPTPKGPFSVKPGGIAQIPFFNPFTDQKKFEFSIDSTSFVLKSTSDVIKARKYSKIIVSLPSTKQLEGYSKCPITGRLVVTCEDEDLKFIKWIFYIQSDR